MGIKFENVYLRCSLTSNGTIPDTGFHGGSPDMFSNGDEPLANYRAVLATEESYAAQPLDLSVVNRDNYCYLRCRNNKNTAVSAKAELFYSKGSLVNWPQNWTPIPVDVKGTTLNDIPSIPPGGIGVVERPFIWNKPVSIETNNHYCLIGRLQTGDSPNPKPDVRSPITMSQIIQTNLMFAQRNIAILPAEGPDGYYSLLLESPAGIEGTGKYHMFFYTKNMKGFDVEITCSMRDSKGNKIGIKRTPIQSDDDIYCGQCYLEPGFSAVASVYIYYNGRPAPSTGYTNFMLEYAGDQTELSFARECGVLNTERSVRLMTKAGIQDAAFLVKLGGYIGMFS